MSLSPDDESSLTIKYGGEYGAPWLVLKGHPSAIRRQLIEAFGYDETELEGVDLASLAAKASADSAAMYALATGTGATPEPRRTGTRRPASAKPEKTEAAPPWDGEETDPETKRVFALIEAATNADELKLAWAKNTDAFEGNDVLQKVYKARAKALKK